MNVQDLRKILRTPAAKKNIERMRLAALADGQPTDVADLHVGPDDRRNPGEDITGTVGFKFELRRPGLPGPLGWITAKIDVDDIAENDASFELGEFRAYV